MKKREEKGQRGFQNFNDKVWAQRRIGDMLAGKCERHVKHYIKQKLC